jgi:glyoxylase-like metal-dependent hydrolase (beta-lactamase superfamily II)
VSEPREVATGVETVVEGVYHWRIHNSAIGGSLSSAHAVVENGQSVWIDPLPLAAPALALLPPPSAIVLTARCHQRSAWRYRAAFGAEVWLPEHATAAEEEPDHTYGPGAALPGGLRALHTPGPELPHYCFLLEREPGVLFCSDLLANDEGAELRFVPFEYHDDPEATKASTAALLGEPFTILCLDHGVPVTSAAKDAIRRLLASSG